MTTGFFFAILLPSVVQQMQKRLLTMQKFFLITILANLIALLHFAHGRLNSAPRLNSRYYNWIAWRPRLKALSPKPQKFTSSPARVQKCPCCNWTRNSLRLLITSTPASAHWADTDQIESRDHLEKKWSPPLSRDPWCTRNRRPAEHQHTWLYLWRLYSCHMALKRESRSGL